MSSDDVDGVVKVIELVGSSPRSFSDAVRNAVKTASKSVRHIQGVDVLSSTAQANEEGELTSYRVHCKIAFLVETARDEPKRTRRSSRSQSGPATASAGSAASRGATR
jgi:flavin-binding protein dodecin